MRLLLLLCGTGRQESLERWEFCIQTTSKFFSYGLGSLYERSPARYRARLDNIRVVSCCIFHQLIPPNLKKLNSEFSLFWDAFGPLCDTWWWFVDI